jgi:beta-glucanase (GH16 family)
VTLRTPHRGGRAAVASLAVALLGAAVAGCGTAAGGSADAAPRSSGRWTVDLRERFDGTTLDAGRWTTCYWWDDGGCTNLGNDEAQWYVPEQVATTDGHLELTAAPERSRHLGRTFSHVSGMVTTGRSGDDPDDAARYAFTYGYVEVRFRTPRGGGLWPAIWMLPVSNESRPEIDLLEQYGDDTREASMTLHTDAPGGTKRVDRRSVRAADLAEGWHTVGLEWTRGRLRWFLDGEERYEVTGPNVPSEPMYLLLNLAVGGTAGDPPASTRFPASFVVDEVTVWRQT